MTAHLQRTVVFVGAGISRSGGLPLFEDLRRDLFANVFDRWWLSKHARLELTNRVALLAPEFAVSLLENGDDNPRAYICERMALGQPAYEHRLLAYALTHGAHVYTPNFDGLIEAAADRALQVSVRQATTDEPSPEAVLFKLHGACPNIIVSAEEVLLAMTASWSDAFAQDCAVPGTQLLVWGYKAADPDLRPVVLRGVEEALRCTWLAFSEEDERIARSLVGHLPRVTIVAADGSREVLRQAAQHVLDIEQTIAPGEDLPTRRAPSFVIKSTETRAGAISHLASARVGRWAWFTVALRGDATAARRVLRSLLFDSKVVQTGALWLLPRIATSRANTEWATASLTAAEGRGVRATTDSLIDRLKPRAIDLESRDSASVEVRARLATLMRERGRLDEAMEMLNLIEVVKNGSSPLSANWRGWVSYERAILLRTAGRLDDAQALLSQFDTTNPVVIGANWGTWLEDEHCALAIRRGDIADAHAHLSRAYEFAQAYGLHRLAVVDLATRQLQIDILAGASLEQTRAGAMACIRLARQHRVLSPLRHAWIDGILADAARHAGNRAAIATQCERLLHSPDLMQQVAATLTLVLLGQPTNVDIPSLLSATGRSRMGSALRGAVSDAPLDPETAALIEEWRAGLGFLFY